MKLPFKLMNKPYIRKQKTPIDKVMAGIAVYEHLSGEYPPIEEISDACKHQKLEYNIGAQERLKAEFPGIQLPPIVIEEDKKDK